jgi:hypothetical protein
MKLDELLASIHEKLAKDLLNRLESGQATTSDLNVIRQFLKDNNVDVSTQTRSPVFKLSEALPFADASSLAVNE